MAKPVRRKKLTKDEEMAAYEEMATNRPQNQIIEQYKINLKCKTQNQKILSNLIKEKEIVICSGPAGSGKTYVTCSVALELLKNDPKYKKIIIVKSVTTLKDEDIGYIKGTVKEKMEPYVYSFIHNFNKIIGESYVSQLRDGNYIQELPLAFIRGINIDNAVVIIDECIHGDSYLDVMIDGVQTRVKTKKLPFYFNNSKDIKVNSFNHNTNITEYKDIQSIKIGKTRTWYKIYLHNRKQPIITTDEHPISVIENNQIIYKKANQIKIDDIIVRGNIHNDNNHNILNNGHDILLGFLLGDGSLSKNSQKYDNIYRLNKNHGMPQQDYCKFCADIFKSPLSYHTKSGFTDQPIVSFTTKSFYVSNDFISTIYNTNNKKRISYDIIKFFTDRTLAMWFMDDGSNNIYTNDGSNITLHTQGFNKNENEILISILKEKFNLLATLKPVKKKRNDRVGEYNTYYTLFFNNENSQLLQDIIKNYIHPNLQYKLNEKYRGYFNESYVNVNLITNVSTISVKDIEIENLPNDELTYNLQVEGNENYFIDRILTHNCQNISIDNMRTIMTRLGENAKMIFLGDENQIDMKKKSDSSLSFIINKFEPLEEIGTIRLTDDDIVRNPLIKKIEQIFKEI